MEAGIFLDVFIALMPRLTANKSTDFLENAGTIMAVIMVRIYYPVPC